MAYGTTHARTNVRWHDPADVRWERTILVPFAPETPASGIGDTDFHRVFWYRRTFDPPALPGDARLILHFGAVDYAATVWVNGIRSSSGMRAATRRSARTSRIISCRTGRRRSSCARTTIRTISPSRAASRTGSASRMRSGIRAPPASGKRSGSKPSPRPRSGNSCWLPNLQRWEIGLEAIDRRATRATASACK